MSQIIMDAIERYYRQGVVDSGESAYEIAKRCGVIGLFNSGDGDLSINYKDVLGKSLDKKYDNR